MTFDIDITNMKAFANKLDLYNLKLKFALKNAYEDFANMFIAKLYSNASKHGVPTSVIENINVDILDTELSISVYGEDIFYFEYGTGIEGANTPHPKDPWEYDVNNHGESGWVYVPKNRSHYSYADYVFEGKSGETLAHTKGIPSKPFVYETMLWGKRSIYNVVRKHLRRIDMIG